MKATAIAHPNVAFIKYWGKKDEILRLPTNGSLSMNVSEFTTTTTVEFSEHFERDEVIIDKKNISDETDRVIKHLDRIRKMANISMYAKVMSENNFPSGTGLSSSSSGFAALTAAAAKAAGLSLEEKELSILARQGSGSACRSIPDGFVEWLDGDTSEASYAASVFPANYWNIVDVVAVVSTEKKDVSTSDGMKHANTSPFFEIRNDHMAKKLEKAKLFIQQKDFQNFGELIEAEALEMHAIMITSQPSLIYWSQGTLKLMKLIKKWRNEGIQSYFTINTGQDIHIICEPKDVPALQEKLTHIDEVKKVFVNTPAEGTRLTETHLF